MALAGYLHGVFLGSMSVFFLMLMVTSFFSNASFSVVFPYMAELWPAQLRASGFGLVYGCSNLAKFIGPAGLAVIAGASNYVAPKATLDALVPGFAYFAVWFLLAVRRLPVRRHRDPRPHDRGARRRAGAAAGAGQNRRAIGQLAQGRVRDRRRTGRICRCAIRGLSYSGRCPSAVVPRLV